MIELSREGKRRLLSKKLPYLSTLVLHLFINDIEPTQDTLVGDFVEANFTGYTAVLVADWSPAKTAQNGSAVTQTCLYAWTVSETSDDQSVYGYYLTDASGLVIMSERRVNGPVRMSVINDRYSLFITFIEETYRICEGPPYTVETQGVIGFIPPGMILPYAGPSVPTGFLFCNGQTVSRATYSDLFAAIGTAFGAGDGSTTFAVPDLRDRVTVGVSPGGLGSRPTARALAAHAGQESVTLSLSTIPSHHHSVSGAAHEHGAIGGVDFVDTSASVNVTPGGATAVYNGHNSTTDTALDAGLVTDNTGTGGAHDNMMPFLVLNYAIKY